MFFNYVAGNVVDNQTISAEVGLHYNHVATWRNRFLDALPALWEIETSAPEKLEGEIRLVLSDKKRSGAPPVFTSDQIMKIVRGVQPSVRNNNSVIHLVRYAASPVSRKYSFGVAAAASTGQLLNLSSLARDVGISQPTAERWLSLLVASNIVYLLQPYSNNITKRAIEFHWYGTSDKLYLFEAPYPKN